MPRSLLRVLALLTLLLAVLAPAARAAEPLDPKNVPDPLKPWTTWALRGSETALCPRLQGQTDVVRCAWPSRLELSVDEKGGRFTQRWHLDATLWVPLPGDDKRWPLDVKVDGGRAVVVMQASLPSVRLERGEHVVTGTFAWDSPPESLRVPPETGLLALTLRGASVPTPVRDAQGSVFLQKTTTAEEGEKLEILVHRKLTDDIPLLLTTHLELDIAGKSREVLLGKALPPGFVPMSLDTQLPARLEPDSRLRVQVRPGRWSIDLVARSEGARDVDQAPRPRRPVARGRGGVDLRGQAGSPARRPQGSELDRSGADQPARGVEALARVPDEGRRRAHVRGEATRRRRSAAEPAHPRAQPVAGLRRRRVHHLGHALGHAESRLAPRDGSADHAGTRGHRRTRSVHHPPRRSHAHGRGGAAGHA